MASILFFSFILFSYSSFAFASSKTLFDAAAVLSDSGYKSMGLTLYLASNTLNLVSAKATIFAPLESAFALSGQPSLFQLQYHICPTRLSNRTLKTLPYGARVPTLLSNHPLIVTPVKSSDARMSINNVLIQKSTVFDDGKLIIYGIDDFFDPSFKTLSCLAVAPSPGLNTETDASDSYDYQDATDFKVDLYDKASNLLMSGGYTKMATFLGIQLGGFISRTRLTIFAPVDEAMEAGAKVFSGYSGMFRRHVVPWLLSWKNLSELEDGTVLSTFSEGFIINVTKSGDIILLNDVPVIFPDMYNSNFLAVHGLTQLIMPPEKKELMEESLSELGDSGPNLPKFDEYEVP